MSSIAGRFGLSTASVLALNGLSWKSLIFPGQVLEAVHVGSVLRRPPAPAAPAVGSGGRYTIAPRRHDLGDRRALRRHHAGRADGQRTRLVEHHLPGPDHRDPGGRQRGPRRCAVRPARPLPSRQRPGRIAPRTRSSPATPSRRSPPASEPRPPRSWPRTGWARSTIIYSGRTLVIPAGSAAPALAATTVSAVTKTNVTPLTDEMAANARAHHPDRPSPRRARPRHRRRARRRHAGVRAAQPQLRRPGLGRHVPAASEHRMGHRGPAAEPDVRDRAVLRRSEQPERRTHARPARHPRLAVDDASRRRRRPCRSRRTPTPTPSGRPAPGPGSPSTGSPPCGSRTFRMALPTLER